VETTEPIVVSVVVPVYRCGEFLEELVSRAISTIEALGHSAELVLVDDRSPDNAWETIQMLARREPSVRGVRLSRNFGQHAAITAGLSACTGSKAVVMDGDLQDPPELIRELLTASTHHPVVLTRRTGNYDAPARRLASHLYFRCVALLGGAQVDSKVGGYALLDRRVIDAFLEFGEQDRHLMFIVDWLGFSRTTVEYHREARPSGRSSYDLRRRIRHGMRGLLFQNTRFLGAVVLLGFVASGLGGAIGLWAVLRQLAGSALPGWTSLVALILTTFGIIVAIQGVIGLYVGRVFEESKRRPVYVIDELANQDDT